MAYQMADFDLELGKSTAQVLFYSVLAFLDAGQYQYCHTHSLVIA